MEAERATPLASIVGGANLPSRLLGRVNATWPLAVLTRHDQRVTIKLRPPGALFGPEPFDVTPHDVEAVFPTRGYLGGRGIGFRLADGTEVYFWTGKGKALLDALEGDGFPVSRDLQRAAKVWGGEA